MTHRKKHTHTSLLVALCAFALVLGLAGGTGSLLGTQAHADPGAPVRIMAFGDALAVGAGSSASTDSMGYRAPLQRALRAAGIEYDMVGSMSTGNAVKFDVNHEGHANYRLDQFTANASRWLTKNPADVILLTAGMYDMVANYQLATAPQRFQTLLAAIRADAPDATILVSTLTDSTNTTYQSRITAYNAAIRTIVAEQEGVELVDLSEVLIPGQDYNGSVNPNDSGYIKIATAWGAALAQVLGVPSLSAAPLKIMPLGDSITYGVGSSNDNDGASYRGFLQRYLNAAGISYDMIGSVRTGVQSRIDTDNEGHSGWRIDQIIAQVPNWMKKTKPDVVLLYIGMNDVRLSYQLPTASVRLNNLIDLIRANAAPGVKIVVGTIYNSSDAALNKKIIPYNVDVRDVVANQAAAHGDVWLAEMENMFTPSVDMADTLHASAPGYAKMARVWASVLSGILPGAGSMANPPMTIMPLGSNVSLGTNSSSAIGSMGYRGVLYRMLSADHNVDMIGSAPSGAIGFADTGSESRSGYRVDQLTARVATYMNSPFGKPEHVLVYTGEVDVANNYQLATFGARYSALIDAIRANDPGADIAVATLIDTTNRTYAPRVAQVNQAIREVVAAQAAYGDVRLVDFTGALAPADIGTGLYPTNSGYTKMAPMWFEGFGAIEPSVPDSVAVSLSTDQIPASAACAGQSSAPAPVVATAVVLDQCGTPLSEVPVSFSTESDAQEEPITAVTDDDGSASAEVVTTADSPVTVSALIDGIPSAITEVSVFDEVCTG